MMGFNVYNDNLDKIKPSKKGVVIINTISPNSYGLTTKDDVFKNALKASDILVLDGVYFALGSIIKNGKAIKKNQGPDVFYYFMDRMKKDGGKVFFLGSSIMTLEKIKKKNKDKYPEIDFEYHSPPYKDEFTDEENLMMIKKINEFRPDVLFIGMTCPKQEKWIYKNRARINAKYAISIGGVFDWYAGNYPELNPLWWKLNLGWLGRALQRPELLKRNMPNCYIYFCDMIKYLRNKETML